MNDKDLVKTQIIYGLEQLLEYAKYLEDNGHLSYELLKQRVETYKGETTMNNKSINFEQWLKTEKGAYQYIGLEDAVPLTMVNEAYDKYREFLKSSDVEMQIYAPSLEKSYVIESDGDSWFAHYDDFTNVVESDEVAFDKTPQEALQKFIDKVKA